MLAAAVLAVAACGTQTEDDPSLTIGPTGPTDDGTDAPGDPAATTPPSGETSAPTATGPGGTGGTDAGEPTDTGAPGTDGAPGTGTPTTVRPTITEESPDTAGTEDSTGTLPGFADRPQEQEAAGAAQLMVDGVRLGLQDGFDRVVLDLSGVGEVGWRVDYVDDPVLDGSGIPVDLAGDHVLQVSAVGMAYPEPGDTTYDGLLLVDGGDLTGVTEVLRGVPFEGQVDVYVGTTDRTPFRVFRLGDPERLVIDVQHP